MVAGINSGYVLECESVGVEVVHVLAVYYRFDMTEVSDNILEN